MISGGFVVLVKFLEILNQIMDSLRVEVLELLAMALSCEMSVKYLSDDL